MVSQNCFMIYTGPKVLITSRQAEPGHVEILGQLLHAAKLVAEKEGILDGFRVVINNGPSACKLLPSVYLSAPIFFVFFVLFFLKDYLYFHSWNIEANQYFLSPSKEKNSVEILFTRMLCFPILPRSIRLSSPFACPWRKADEMATWLKKYLKLICIKTYSFAFLSPEPRENLDLKLGNMNGLFFFANDFRLLVLFTWLGWD